MILRDGTKAWVPLDLPGLEVQAPEQVQNLVCVTETMQECGTYEDGSKGFCRNWNVDMVSWPKGTPLFQGNTYADIPNRKQTGGDFYTPLQPIQELTSLISAAAQPQATWVPFGITNIPVAVSADASFLLTTENNGSSDQLNGWDVKTLKHLWSFVESPRSVYFTPIIDSKNQAVIVVSTPLTEPYQRILYWIDMHTGQTIHTFSLSGDGGYAGAVLAPETSTLYTTEPGKIQIIDAKSATIQATLNFDGSSDTLVEAVSPDQKYLATNSPTDNRVDIWDIQARKITQSIPGVAFPGNWRGCLQFLPDGKRMIKCSYDTKQFTYTIAFFDTQTWQQINQIVIPASIIGSVSPSPDGRWLAVPLSDADFPERIALYDLDTLQLARTLRVGTDQVEVYAFTPDSQTLWFVDHSETLANNEILVPFFIAQ